MILILDNYDSFTYNLVDYFQQIGLDLIIKKNDENLDDIKKLTFDAIVISPGPETPEKAGITNEIIDYYYKKLPILGICLGHQAIGLYFGSKLEKAKYPKHGKTSQIKTSATDVFTNIPDKFNVTRYHSLVLKDISNELLQTSISLDDNEIMSFKHKTLPIWGIQFHPEAVLTEYGLNILQNWATINKLIRP